MVRAAALPPDERRRAIVEAVKPLVMTHGANLTSKQIAEAAGVAEGTLFRAFSDKQEIIYAAISSLMDSTPTVTALEAVAPPTLAEATHQLFDILTRRMREIGGLFMTLRTNPSETPADRCPRSSADGHHRVTIALIDATAVTLARYEQQLAVPPTRAAQYLFTLASTSSPIFDAHAVPSVVDLTFFFLHGITRTES